MTEEALVDHIFVRLEPRVQDYLEVRNPTTTAQLLHVLAKFEERNSHKKMQGSKYSGNVERRGWNASRRGNYESRRQRNQWIESRNELNRDDRRFDRGYQSRNRVQSENFSRGNHRNSGSRTNFSRGNQRQGGRLNVLKVKDAQIDQSQSVREVPIKLSAICMSPVELPYVLILSNETFTKALWDTEKNNGLPPDNPEAYRFAVDYRKRNAIINYPRYPLPLIDDLITNIPHVQCTYVNVERPLALRVSNESV
ncbi:hypothetical protein TNCV_3571071 [Trichonephila clavipes]|nr:hypothetical protein TNCV_3571071 [Trichonephila clavipes]